MAVPCEFEEDAFQQQVDLAIGRTTNISTTPGRVTEHILGYDAAFSVGSKLQKDLSSVFYVRRSRRSRPWGAIRVDGSIWGDLTDILTKLPPFKLNLFLQYKVPEKMIHGSAAEWTCWHEPYFRFNLRQPQHDILLRISRAATSPVVAYCAPAFIDCDTLWKVTEECSVIDHSHFVRAGRLQAHHRYSFVSARGAGFGHSESSEFPNESVEEIILNPLAAAKDRDLPSLLEDAAETIVAAAGGDTPIEGAFRKAISTIPDGMTVVNRSLAIINASEIFLGINVMIIG